MSELNIYHINSIMQEASEGRYTMQGLALTNIIHNVIREYGKYDGVNYSVNLSEVDLTDRKLILSHILEASDYEWAMKSDTRINAMFGEYKKQIENLIDSECAAVYREDMEEMGMTSRNHSDNHEQFWARR